MTSKQDTPNTYRSRIQEVELNSTQPTTLMPEKLPAQDWTDEFSSSRGMSLSFAVLILAILSFFGFSAFSAIDTLISKFEYFPITTSILAVLLSGLVVSIVCLIANEIRGVFAVKKYLVSKLDFAQLRQITERKELEKQLHQHAKSFHNKSYAAHQYLVFLQSLNSDLTTAEVLALYENRVVVQVKLKAKEVLKKESIVSGSLSFVSPNSFIQTLLVIWISIRTVKRLAQVYGLRTGKMGTWRLLKILAQNIAAQSFLDLASDELTNQISGSLTAKFLENSAEAIAAGALNVRLGKAFIQLLESRN